MEEKRAPKGKFRIIGVDTYEGPTADYVIGDYPSLAKAMKEAKKHGGEMNPVYVYDDNENLVFSAGSY